MLRKLMCLMLHTRNGPVGGHPWAPDRCARCGKRWRRFGPQRAPDVRLERLGQEARGPSCSTGYRSCRRRAGVIEAHYKPVLAIDAESNKILCSFPTLMEAREQFKGEKSPVRFVTLVSEPPEDSVT